jgi:hypothetical protein
MLSGRVEGSELIPDAIAEVLVVLIVDLVESLGEHSLPIHELLVSNGLSGEFENGRICIDARPFRGRDENKVFVNSRSCPLVSCLKSLLKPRFAPNETTIFNPLLSRMSCSVFTGSRT